MGVVASTRTVSTQLNWGEREREIQLVKADRQRIDSKHGMELGSRCVLSSVCRSVVVADAVVAAVVVRGSVG